ncbi:TetR/AcrR family transcriptional regulator [Rhodococcus chondri]|uniref:TetR/AcrR family transcriptional regulator n=1 Tax=Rhodococcus chondri TaxID=3065941 RepID=A0ABU7JVG3_9NOCA|nr:TetR/AcrR family transcriptional regulator [Rhodococcus sp. CC-R104]MEE2033282.1 TetR/AcrR family transcriptional regulator [Rhodococcus sp. CC-R104]
MSARGTRSNHLPKRDSAARSHILDAAEVLFARHGFDATPTAAIATAAQVPKGLIFYYFPTKAAILEALISERCPVDPLADLTALVAPGDPATSLVNLDNALNLCDHDSSVLRVIIWREAETHPGARTRLRMLRSYLRDATVRVLQASVPGPVSPNALRAAAATWVSAMFSAAATDRWFDLDGLPRSREELRNVARLVAAGLSGITSLALS